MRTRSLEKHVKSCRFCTKGHNVTVSLPPAAVDENISAIAVHVSRSHPNGVRPRWHLPPARRPYIRAAVPAMISANPHVPTARPNQPVLHHCTWRTSSDHNLFRLGRTYPNRYAEQRCQEKFAQKCISGHLLSTQMAVKWRSHSPARQPPVNRWRMPDRACYLQNPP